MAFARSRTWLKIRCPLGATAVVPALPFWAVLGWAGAVGLGATATVVGVAAAVVGEVAVAGEPPLQAAASSRVSEPKSQYKRTGRLIFTTSSPTSQAALRATEPA